MSLCRQGVDLAMLVIQANCTHIGVFQTALGHPVYTHGETAGRVRADDTAIGLHPVRRMTLALFGR